MSTPPDHPAPRQTCSVPHRKNAAEWVLWLALLPFFPIAHLLERVRIISEEKHG